MACSYKMTDCCGHQKPPLDARIPQQDIAALYDGKAAYYDIWGMLTESRARKKALELADIKDGQTVLEAAVGTGLAFVEIARRNPNGVNIGVDLSSEMLAKAKNRLRPLTHANYSLYLGNAFDLNLGDGSVDVLVNNYMFDLIKFADMDKVLAEFKRVLKKDGKLVLVNMTLGERFGANFYEYLYRFAPKLMGACRGVQLSDTLIQNGFTVTTREYHQQFLFPSEVILAYK